jgi:hypothetical protein
LQLSLRQSQQPLVQQDPTAAKKQAPIDSGSASMSSGTAHHERIKMEQVTATATCLAAPLSTTETRAFVSVDREINCERRCLIAPGSSFLLAISDHHHRI